jgi:hypothetical protein
MKKAILMMVTMFLAGCGGTGLVVKQMDDAHVIPMRDIGTFKDVRELGRYAAYFDQGDHLPLQFDVKTEIIDTHEKKIDLVFKKRVYVRAEIPGDLSDAQLAELQRNWADRSTMNDSGKAEFLKHFMLYVSLDGRQWAACNDPDALRQVLDISGGNISFGVGVDEKTGINSTFSLRAIPAGR